MVFGKKQKLSPAQELAELRAERRELEAEYSERKELSDLKKKVKEDKKALRKLKSELHPSAYRKFGKFLVEAGKGTYGVTKEAWNEYDKFHTHLNKERAHAQKRKKVLKQIS